MGGCAQSYCILLEHDQWLSLRGLFFFLKGNKGGVDLGERESVGREWGEWKVWCQDVMYETRMKVKTTTKQPISKSKNSPNHHCLIIYISNNSITW